MEVRFSRGTDSTELFGDIVNHLASVRGVTPDVLGGVGHGLYLRPDVAAAYVGRHSG